MPRRDSWGAAHDVQAIRGEIDRFLDTRDAAGRIAANAKYGVYAFYDYDGEPIYVGQTAERLRVRIRRHLTNQRTDAVAMNVLDPFEVAEVEMWPLYPETAAEGGAMLAAAERAVYEKVIRESGVGAVLNEKDIPPAPAFELPPSHRGRIIPEGLYEQRKHPDIRIARRASTIASLAKVISERDVSKGLRRTLLTQAQRLERLARARFGEVGGEVPVETTADLEE